VTSPVNNPIVGFDSHTGQGFKFICPELGLHG